MKIVEIILMPFVWLYKGFIAFLLLPYYAVLGIARVLGFGKSENAKNKTIPELKNGEKVKVVKGVRSAYEKTEKPEEVVDPIKAQKEKEIKAQKRQKEFERLMKKAKEEEEKRMAEQEKLRVQREKKELEKKLREAEELKKEEERDAKIEELRSQGVSATFSDKLKAFWKKINTNPKEEMELEVKKAVLDEHFSELQNSSDNSNNNASRFSNPIVFNYIAKNSKGELEKSSIEALSRIDVHSFLTSEGYEVFEITPAATGLAMNDLFRYKLKTNRLIFYLTQLSAYLKSGIALSDGVKILHDQAKNNNEKKIWRAVYYDLSMGDVLSVALNKRGGTFPSLLVNMIKTAEMTGDLIETLDDMVEYYTESESTRKQMVSAMLYPIVISIFAVVVVTFIILWVVPQFVSMYNDLGSDLPGITKFLVAFSEFLQNYLLYISMGLVVLLIIYMFMFKNIKSFRKMMQTFMMHLPIFGNIIIYNEVTMFTKTFANLINHNVFITDSMEVLGKITENEVYKKLIYDTAKNLTKGETISLAFKDHWAFPNIAYQMLITGEKTGRLGPMMERVSDYYQEQHRNIINQMKSLIEPVLIVSLAVIVGGILLAVILPMYGMYDSL